MSIYLIGDGILDNYRSLTNKELDLKQEISNLGYVVHNYAIDEIKLTEVVNGFIPSKLLITGRNYDYVLDKEGKFSPLLELTKKTNPNKSFTSVYQNFASVEPKKQPNNMAVISIGGADVGLRMFNIAFGIEYFINAILTEEFINNYEKLIRTVENTCKKIILVSMYLPYIGPNSSYGKYASYASSIMNKWHDFLYGLAKKHNIPVLDLNRTLDNKNRLHYGIDDTRTSNISSKCIAKCLTYIYDNYNGHYIYYAPNCNAAKIISET